MSGIAQKPQLVSVQLRVFGTRLAMEEAFIAISLGGV
jgi:hypothetical protein